MFSDRSNVLTPFVCTQLLSRVQFFVTPWTILSQNSLSVRFPRPEYWSGLPFPMGCCKVLTYNSDELCIKEYIGLWCCFFKVSLAIGTFCQYSVCAWKLYIYTHKHTLTDAHTSVSAYAHLQTCILRGIDFVYSYQITFYLLIWSVPRKCYFNFLSYFFPTFLHLKCYRLTLYINIK